MNFVDQFHQQGNELSEIIQSFLLSKPDHQWLPHNDRRDKPRFDVNMSAMICYVDQPVWMPIFIRDMSGGGIGFRHGVPLPEGTATISFKLENGQSTQLNVEVLWCRNDGNSMYISGSQFLSVADDVESPW